MNLVWYTFSFLLNGYIALRDIKNLQQQDAFIVYDYNISQ